MKKRMLSAITALILPLSISFSEPLKVITSFSILEDMTQNIGKDKVSVESIIGPDQEAHSFEPTPKDIIKIKNADVVILNGVGFDNWLHKILDANKYEGIIIQANQNVPLIAFTDEGMDDNHEHDAHTHENHTHDMQSQADNHDEHAHNHSHAHGEFDPHIWQSPKNAIIMSENITTGLSLAAPESAPYFDKNFTDYKVSLEALDQYAQAAFKDIDTNPRLMVLHNSFGYLARAYDLHFIAISTLNPMAEPSAKKMAELYRFVKAENIQAIFSENIAPSRFISTLSKDLNLEDGGVLYSDALTKAGPANTYIDLFKHNIDQIRKTLLKTPQNSTKE